MSDGPLAPYGLPSGWYEDPHNRDLLRWWDGGRWTGPTKPVPREAATQVRSLRPSPGTWQSARSGHGDQGFAPDGQTRLRDEPPRFAHADPAPIGHADDTDTHVNDSVTHANHIYRDEDRGARRGTAPEVAGRSAAPQAVVGRTASPAAPSVAEKMRRSGLSRLGLSALFVFSLLLFAAGFALGNEVLRLVALTGALIFGVGTAPLQLSERASLGLRLGVAVLMALSVPAVVGSVMVLVPVWHPLLAAVLFGFAAAWVHVVACRRVLSGPLGTGILRLVRPRIGDLLDPSVACSLTGTVLWVAGMIATGHVVPGLFGFLPKAPVYWYLGLGLVLIGIMLARGEHEVRVAFGVISLLAALTLTPSVVYGWPRQPAGVKHVDLVQTILQAHYLNHGGGIYNAYSGFFSSVAWICDVARMQNVMGIATYWPFFIGLLAVVALRFFLRRLTSSPYRIWVAITLVILVNTVGQDYFSPQSVGFVEGIVVFGLALDRGGIPGLSERGRLSLMVLAACAMAVTHELTPYIVGGVLVILVLFRVIRPWYLPIVVLIPAGIWAALNKGDLSGFVTLQDLGNLSNFAPPKQATTYSLQRLPIVGESSDALTLGLLVLIVIACIGLVRNIRNRYAWAFMVSTGLGLVVIAVNPYGNEGVFRAALFSLPWLAAVGSWVLPGVRSRWSSAIYGIIAAGLVCTYLISEFGLDNINVVRPSDYEAMLKYQALASENSYLFDLSAAGGGILPQSVDFPREASHSVDWSTLLTSAQLRIVNPTPRDADTIAREYYQYAKSNGGETGELYGVWSPIAANYGVDYGLETLAQSEGWRAAMIASPDWKVVWSSDGTYLFRVTANVLKQEKPKKAK